MTFAAAEGLERCRTDAGFPLSFVAPWRCQNGSLHVRNQGNECPPGEAGEILLKGDKCDLRVLAQAAGNGGRIPR
jgi:hypothetical protein